MRKLAPLLLGAAISIGAVVILFSQVNFKEVIENIRRANVIYLLLLALMYPVSMYIRSVRWQHFLQAHLPFWRAFHITNIGYFFNAVLPFRLGEFVRILLMSREPQHSAGAGFSALTLERLLDLSFALLCVGLGLVLLPENAALPTETTSTLGILIVI
ncbi:MAG: flippase-like domain-containing protein, partial [Anaerolineae bacterium]|nr:flippase-like domain-containing protein [Anaerolineae bacterium]